MIWQDFPAKEGDLFRIVVWVKTVEMQHKGVWAGVLWLNRDDGEELGKLAGWEALRREQVMVRADAFENIDAMEGTVPWRRFSQRVTAPEGTKTVRFYLAVHANPKGKSAAAFDNLEFRRER